MSTARLPSFCRLVQGAKGPSRPQDAAAVAVALPLLLIRLPLSLVAQEKLSGYRYECRAAQLLEVTGSMPLGRCVSLHGLFAGVFACLLAYTIVGQLIQLH